MRPTQRDPSAALTLVVGTILDGRFKIEQLIGRGGMAIVYRASALDTGETVALKIFSPRAAFDDADLGRFSRESRVLEQLNHPGIVGYLSHGTTATGQHYIVMQYFEGSSLQAVLDNGGNKGLPLPKCVNLLAQLAHALGYLHSLAIVHRDIKPSNVLLTKDQSVKLLDFGLARTIDASGQLSFRGEILGSAYFMSPEQRTGALVGWTTQFDQRSDIYSLGVLAFTIAVGSPPFAAEGMDEAKLNLLHSTELIPSCASFGAQVPDWYEQLIAIATEKKPHNRFQTADELAKFLITSYHENLGFWHKLRSLFRRS